MNLTDIMLFGKAINGGGSGGSSGGGAWYMSEQVSDDELIGGMYKLTDRAFTVTELEGGFFGFFTSSGESIFAPLSAELNTIFEDAGWVYIVVGSAMAISIGDGSGEDMGVSNGTYLMVADIETGERTIVSCALIWK